jgi:hypothetical protein
VPSMNTVFFSTAAKIIRMACLSIISAPVIWVPSANGTVETHPLHFLFNLKQSTPAHAHWAMPHRYLLYIHHTSSPFSELQLSRMPRLEAAMDKVIASTNQLERSLGQFILDKWVGLQVSKRQIDSLLHSIQKCKKATSVSNILIRLG